MTMGQSLEVNNKTYLPSVVLAKQFNYTSDYISKLARDEKILGTRVGRQWFVEPESLRTFILQLEVEKRIVKEDLSLERKRERTEKSLHAKDRTYATQPAIIVSGKSAAIVLCGFILGCLTLATHVSGLTVADFAYGSQSIGKLLQEKIASGVVTLLPKQHNQFQSIANPLLSEQPPLVILEAVTETSGSTDGVYTVFPDITYATTSLALPLEDSLAAARPATLDTLPFSDEVMFEEREGVLGVRPIFKDSEGQLYELSVTAVQSTE